VLRTPGGTAVFIFGVLKMVLQEKSWLKARFFVKPAATPKPDPRDRHVSLYSDRTTEVI
jgi:hypothetical protein